MDVGTFSILESVTQKTLHAHNFNRASSEATHVLTDLLSRYLHLLSSTCAQYAQHAGRTSATVGDAIVALGEMGVSVEELIDYGEVEGREMSRYSISTARRKEELPLLRASLAEGLRIEQGDAIKLVYERVPTPPPSFIDEDVDSDEEDSEMEVEQSIAGPTMHDPPWSPPALPPSPISRSPSPTRKRHRTSAWSHIPDFLPPFPSSTPPPSPPPTHEPDRQLPRMEQRMLTPPPQLASSTTGSDYLTPVPYSMSSLRTAHETHLPERPDSRLVFATPDAKYPTPQPSEALITAYHHVLTNPPSQHPPTNPQRHRVALSLLAQMYTAPRWTVSDTLFSNLVPPKPRVLAPSPSFPVPLKDTAANGEHGKDKRQLLVPPSTGKSVLVTESITPSSSQPKSRIPDIASQILPPSVFVRATRVNHPLPLVSASNEKFLYGGGVPAPWNSTVTPSPNDAPNKLRDRGNSNATTNGVSPDSGDDRSSTLADARLFATWDWEVHDFRQPIPPSMKRWRSGSVAIPHRPSISINVGGSTPGPTVGPSKKRTKDVKNEKGR